MDGKVVIGTELNTDDFDARIEVLEQKLEDLGQQYEMASKHAQNGKKHAKAYMTEIGLEIDKVKNRLEILQRLRDSQVTSNVLPDTKSYDEQIAQVETKLKDLRQQYEIAFNSAQKGSKTGVYAMQELGIEIEKTTNKIVELKRQKEKAEGKTSTGLMKWAQSFGKELTKATNKVIKLGLAFFGIRSAYNFLLSSMHTMANYNEQLKVDIQYIKFALASMLQPVVERLVQLAYQLLRVLASVIKTITGINIFKNAGIDKFKKGLDGSVSSAKELKNQLAGFDEMNVLQDNSGGGGGGGAGDILPSDNLSDVTKIKLPEWFDEVASAVIGLIGALEGLKIIKMLEKLGLIKKLSGKELATKLVGIGIAIAGITYAVIGLIKYIKDPSWENLGQVITGIGIALVGLGIAFFGLPVIIAGVITLILGIIISNWETIKSFFVGIMTWLYEQASSVGGVAGLIIESVGQLVEIIIFTLGLVVDGVKRILDGIISLVKAVIDGDFNAILDSLLQIIIGVLEVIVGVIGNIVGVILSIIKTAILIIVEIIYEIFGIISNISSSITNAIESGIRFLIDLFSFFGKVIVLSMQQAFEGIKSAFSSIGNFFSNIISKIMGMFQTIGTSAGNVVGNAFKGVVNGVLGAIESILNSPIKSINAMIKEINKIPGVNIGKLSTFKFPRLAKGGIVNMPGRGVNYGGANMGEHGKEGVIPLTDSQQMALLGEAIGKYITINATITNTMNGRVISRELKKVNAENDFAYNR